jgi:hypothetical protein
VVSEVRPLTSLTFRTSGSDARRDHRVMARRATLGDVFRPAEDGGWLEVELDGAKEYAAYLEDAVPDPGWA